MSDMNTLVQKTREGQEWRGTITVNDDGDEVELTVRNLTSPEIEEVFRLIDREEFDTLEEELPKEKMEKRRELLDIGEEERDEEEEARLEELNEELKGEHMKMFDILSADTFKGIRLAAKKGVEPDEDDMAEALRDRAYEIEEETGRRVERPEDTHDFLKEELEEVVENSTRFVGFQIGMKVLQETGAEEGN
jgi:hypothetical protein